MGGDRADDRAGGTRLRAEDGRRGIACGVALFRTARKATTSARHGKAAVTSAGPERATWRNPTQDGATGHLSAPRKRISTQGQAGGRQMRHAESKDGTVVQARVHGEGVSAARSSRRRVVQGAEAQVSHAVQRGHSAERPSPGERSYGSSV